MGQEKGRGRRKERGKERDLKQVYLAGVESSVTKMQCEMQFRALL